MKVVFVSSMEKCSVDLYNVLVLHVRILSTTQENAVPVVSVRFQNYLITIYFRVPFPVYIKLNL